MKTINILGVEVSETFFLLVKGRVINERIDEAVSIIMDRYKLRKQLAEHVVYEIIGM